MVVPSNVHIVYGRLCIVWVMFTHVLLFFGKRTRVMMSVHGFSKSVLNGDIRFVGFYSMFAFDCFLK